jgi:hypothetical protein
MMPDGHQEPGRFPMRTLIITRWPGVPPMTIEQGLVRAGALILGILGGARLPPAGPGSLAVAFVVAAVVSVAADRLHPPPTTAFLPRGWCEASRVSVGDWICDGRWAVRVVDRVATPTGSPPSALRSWRLTLTDGGLVDVAEDQSLLLLRPIRLRGGDRLTPVLEVAGEQALSPRHARTLRRIHRLQRAGDLEQAHRGGQRDGAQ